MHVYACTYGGGPPGLHREVPWPRLAPGPIYIWKHRLSKFYVYLYRTSVYKYYAPCAPDGQHGRHVIAVRRGGGRRQREGDARQEEARGEAMGGHEADEAYPHV